MRIDSIRRIKSYKREGHLVGVCEIILPRIISDDDLSFINSYYSMMADKVFSLADDYFLSCTEFSKIKIDFSALEESNAQALPRRYGKIKNRLVIKRSLSISSKGGRRDFEFTDCFDLYLKAIKG